MEKKSTSHQKRKLSGKDIHLIFLALVVIILIVIIARVLIWNKGTKSNYDPNDLMEGFDTESNDMMFYLDSKDLEGHEDDGINTVLFLGNDQLSYGSDGTTVPDYVAQNLGNADVINCSFPGSIASTYQSGGNPNDAFSFYFLIISLINQDFSFQDTNLPLADCVDSSYQATLDRLKSVSLDKIDTLVIGYDASDYLADRGLWNPNNDSDITCFQGSLYAGISLLKQSCPYIRIIVSSPTYAMYVDENGDTHSGDTYSSGNGELYVYVTQEGAAASSLSVSFIDNYYGSVHSDNYTEYLENHILLNDSGRQFIAKRITNFIKGIQ